MRFFTVLILTLSSYLVAESSEYNYFKCSQNRSQSRSIVIVIEESLALGLMDEVRGYQDDICTKSGYSSWVTIGSRDTTKHVDSVLEIQKQDPNVEGTFLIGNIKSDTFVNYVRLKQNTVSNVTLNKIIGAYANAWLPTPLSDRRLDLPPSYFSKDPANNYYINFPITKEQLSHMRYSARLPLGGVEFLNFYKHYFKKIHLARFGKITHKKTLFLAAEKDGPIERVPEILSTASSAGFATNLTLTETYLKDSKNEYQKRVNNGLAENFQIAILGFHGDENGNLAYNRWGAQNVVTGSSVLTNSRLLIVISCNTARNESDPNAIIFRSLIYGHTLNVIASRSFIFKSPASISGQFIDSIAQKKSTVGESFRSFVDINLVASLKENYQIFALDNIQSIHLYGDPLSQLEPF